MKNNDLYKKTHLELNYVLIENSEKLKSSISHACSYDFSTFKDRPRASVILSNKSLPVQIYCLNNEQNIVFQWTH